MPQLDKVTFFSQFFWLSFFFLGFYIVLVKYYLPKMSRILKVRNIKVSSSQEGFSDVKKENGLVREGVDNLVIRGLKNSKQFFHESFQNTSQWVNAVVEMTNKKQFENMNKTYLSTVGDFHMSQTLLLNHLKTILAPSSFQVWAKEFSGTFGPRNSKQRENLYTFKVLEKIIN
jgi:F-type H+-transporting ATPase subunit b